MAMNEPKEDPANPKPDETQTASGPANVKPRRKITWGFWITFLVVCLVLAAIAIPNFLRPRTTACKNGCIANLRQIDGAKQQWALENKSGSDDVATVADVSTYLKGGVLPLCEEGGTYTVGKVSENPICSKGAAHGHTL